MRPFIALYVGGMGSREKNFYNALVRRYGFEDAAAGDPGPLPRRQEGGGGRRDPARADRHGHDLRPARPGQGAARGLPRGGRRHADRVPDGLRARAAQADGPRARGDALSERRRRRILLAAFGDPGHAFPAIALGRELAAPRARGDARDLVEVARARRARGDALRGGARVPGVPDRAGGRSSPTRPRCGRRRETRELIRAVDPEVVVADILTVAAALAAELEERPWVTLVPHVLPMGEPGFPVYAVGRRLPAHRASGARLWRATRPLLMRGEEQGRDELNGARARVGLPPLDHVHGGISRAARAGGDLPPARVPAPRARALAAGDRAAAVGAAVRRGRAAARATSRSCWWRRAPRRTPSTGCCARRSRGSPTSRCACWRRPTGARRSGRCRVPPNARLVDWVSYARTMPRCAAVVCHAGHGTVARALACGVPVVACPHAGDMAENARAHALGGPRACRCRAASTPPRGVRLAVRRLLADPGYAERAAERRATGASATTARRPRRTRVEAARVMRR